MPKEAEFFNAASATESAAVPMASKVAESTSSARYRVSSRSSADTPDAALRSPETRLSSLVTRMSKNSDSPLPASGPSGADGPTTGKTKNPRYAIATEATSSPKASGTTTGTPKLPQKLRQHVNRLRNQLMLGPGPGSSRNVLSVGGRSPSPTSSPQKAPPRSSMTAPSINSKRFSLATAAIQYSRRSNQFKQLQANKEDGKLAELVFNGPASSQDPKTAAVNAGTFQDLLRPLQTSLSYAGLNDGWSSDEEDEAEQLFRQSERENSRLLRVCCSIDNLMLSIGDRAQEQKQTEAIVRGATRDLVQLFQYAMQQVISIVFGKTEDQANNTETGDESRSVGVKIDGKEAQYAMEFLLEINERIGKLYEFARAVFVTEVDGLRQRAKELDDALAAAALANEQLQNEMRDLRDFHEQNSASAVDDFGVGTSGTINSGLNDRSDDAAVSGLAFPEIPEVNTGTGDDECSALKQQCQELSRLLEMAKQEIRLSHHERDVQKARVAEMSNALFRDSEVSMLRNQLHSEKRRVRTLERENLTLRESQQAEALKLDALHAATSASAVTAKDDSGASSAARNNISTKHSSVDVAPATTRADQPLQKESAGGSPLEQFVPSASALMIETQDHEYNFISSGVIQPDIPQDEAQVTVINWFSRIITPPQPTNVRKPRKKQTEAKPEQHAPVAYSKFLAGLLMTDKQFATAKDESKVRRQGNVPTLVPPIGALSARRSTEERKATNKRRRPQSASSTSATSNNINRENSAEAEDNPEEVIASCLQLVWVFYQRFLLAVEAQNLLGIRGLGGDPMMGTSIGCSAGNPALEPVSLSMVIFHFFLERCSGEQDAVRELEQFVRCLHNVRSGDYGLELFCQFLEEICSREELCFFLWVCQAMDDIKLGISYDDPLPSNQEIDLQNGPTRFLCVLKATFLARTIFRLLHFKVLCRPPATRSGKRRQKPKPSPAKRSSNNAASANAPTTPLASPKRKPKTRIGELTATLSPKAISTIPIASIGEPEQEQEKEIPLYVAAQTALREIIENNQGEPITLETFNNLLLKYAVVPSSEELTARLGPFYQPTGDERKIPTDVFLALLVETYKFQLQWQRDQLRALFIHVNHQEEVQQRAADAANDRGDGADKKQSKPRTKRKKSRGGAADGGSKYERGLSRSVLRELLLQAGIVSDSDMAQVDIDWLFAELLKTAGGVAADITFDALFDLLQKMRWLDSTNLRVDALVTNVTGILPVKRNSVGADLQRVKTSSKLRSSSVTVPSPMVSAIREKWQVYARHSLALCNNDPNVFIRRHSERLLHYVDQTLVRLVSELESSNAVNVNGDAMECIREFLAFAWRVAAKRSGGADTGTSYLKQTCFTEVYFISQALRSTVNSMAGHRGQVATIENKAVEPAERGSMVIRGALRSFYDTSRMKLNRLTKLTATSNFDAGQLAELEGVLTLYAAHIAHLFQRFSEARYNCSPQVSFHRWRAMIYDLDLVHPRYLALSKLQSLFTNVVELNSTDTVSPDHEVGVGKASFSELFVLIALERHRVAVDRKREKAQLIQGGNNEAFLKDLELAGHPARVMAQFCREILAPRAFGGENALVERNFTAKLSCPLVGRALLEHRSFLRTVFFYYAKQDEVAADELAALEEQTLLRELQENGGQLIGAKESGTAISSADANAALLQPNPGSDFQLEKTKRSSMSFGEFETFLTAFGLLDNCHHGKWSSGNVALADAQQIFSSVMALDNDDTLQLEFDEFAAAIVALAVHLNPSPFSLWHQKLDEFATRLQRMWETQNEESNSA